MPAKMFTGAETLRARLFILLRWILWLLLAVILVRGAVSIAMPPTEAPAVAPAPPEPAPVDTEGARVFAALFVREYLTWTPRGEAERSGRLAPFLAGHLDSKAGFHQVETERGQRVTGAWPWGLKVLSNPRRAQVTVVAEVVPVDAEGREGSPRQVALAVPVALEGGGFVIYDLPAFIPMPAPGRWTGGVYSGTQVPDAVPQVRELLTGFFRAYTQGTPAELSYFLVPGATLSGLGGQFRFREVGSLEVLQTGSDYWAPVEVVLEDFAAGAAYRQRFLVKLARQERWYVADIQQKGEWSR